MKRLLLSTAVATLILGGAAQAQTFDYQGFSVDPANVQITLTNPVNKTVLVGEITLNGTGPNMGQNLAVWCLDVFDQLQTGPYAYQETTVTAGLQLQGWTSPITTTQIQQIGDLMEQVNGGINNDKAAVQLAIWASLYGSGFSFLGGSGTLASDEAADLAAVQTGGLFFNPNVSITALHDAITAPNQTVGFAAPVPAPIVGAGLPGLFGLLGIWYANRRKRRVA